jgi:hypothetical protein
MYYYYAPTGAILGCFAESLAFVTTGDTQEYETLPLGKTTYQDAFVGCPFSVRMIPRLPEPEINCLLISGYTLSHLSITGGRSNSLGPLGDPS